MTFPGFFQDCVNPESCNVYNLTASSGEVVDYNEYMWITSTYHCIAV